MRVGDIALSRSFMQYNSAAYRVPTSHFDSSKSQRGIVL